MEEVALQKERVLEDLARAQEELRASRDALRKAKKAHGATCACRRVCSMCHVGRLQVDMCGAVHSG